MLGLLRFFLIVAGLSSAGSIFFTVQSLASEAMKVTLVRDEHCTANCSGWISAEGKITKSTVAEFKALFRLVGDKKLPIIIHSGGGEITAAEEIGRLIRKRGHDVAVGRTRFAQCVPGSECAAMFGKSGLPGKLATGGISFCASACSLILAAGRERILIDRAVVGVHQMQVRRSEGTMRRYRIHYRVVGGRRYEVSRELVSTRIIPAKEFSPARNSQEYVRLARYFASMGVDKNIIELFHKAPYEGMHWLLENDLTATRIVTGRRAAASFLSNPASGPAERIAVEASKAQISAPSVPPPPEPSSNTGGTLQREDRDVIVVTGSARDGRLARIALRFNIRPDQTGASIGATFTLDGRAVPQNRVHLAIELNGGRTVIEETGDLNAPDAAPLVMYLSHYYACWIYSGKPTAYVFKIWDSGSVAPLNIQFTAPGPGFTGYHTHPNCDNSPTAKTASVAREPSAQTVPEGHRFHQPNRALLAQSRIALSPETSPKSRIEIDFLHNAKDQMAEAEVFVIIDDQRLRSGIEMEFTHETLGTLIARRSDGAPGFAPLRFSIPVHALCGWKKGGNIALAIRFLDEAGRETRVLTHTAPALDLRNQPRELSC